MNTEEAAQQIMNGLGTQVWWDLDSTQVTPPRLREILAAEGVDIEVPDIVPEQAIRRAARRWTSSEGNETKFKMEVTAVDGGDMYIGLLKRIRVDGKTVGWEQVELISYDINGGVWRKKDTYSDEALSFTRQADEFMTYHDAKWIRPNVIQAKLHDCGAIALRRQGGIYFVPAKFMDDLKALKRVVAAIGNSRLHLMHVMNDEDGRDSVEACIGSHVVSELGDISNKLDEWRKSTRKVRSDSRANVLGALSDLLDVAGLYEGALGQELADVRSKIDACRDDAMAILAGQELDAA